MDREPQEVDDYDGADEAIRYALCRWCSRSEGHSPGCPQEEIDDLLARGPHNE